MSKDPRTPRISNRKAAHRYEVLEHVEAGIALTGSEVKSLRSGHASLEEAYGFIRAGQAFLRDCNIQPYAHAGPRQPAPTRERRLLLHKRQIRKLHVQVSQKGLTLIPLGMYFNDRGIVKIQLALCRGKKAYDKRSDIRAREHERDMSRAMKRRRGR
jgi:SsrA-binding protein